ncbi:hypothetical protein [Streptomyces sp. NPDC127084]|uniref:hypothetical protein n=1 Tax=Streptomyces sp. NPDC127084 TaxID=3347133 RepID=UPI00364E7047
MITQETAADPAEIAWHGRLTFQELQETVREWRFVEDGIDTLRRYRAGKTD